MVYRRRYGRRNFKRKAWWTRPSKRKYLFRRPRGKKVRAAGRGGLGGPVFGQRGHWATLVYVENSLLDPSSTTAAVNNYGCNNIYDPYTGTGGAQPNGFDQLMAFYKYAYVTSATCTMTPITNAVEAPGEFFIAQSSDGTDNWNGIQSAWETNLKRSRIKLAGGWPFAGMGETRNSVTTTWTAKSWFKKNVIGDLHYANSASGGPATAYAPQFSCVYKPVTSAVNPAETTFRIYIRYRVYFCEPKMLPQS